MPNQRLERPRAREDRLRSRRTGHACVRGLKLIVRPRAAIEYYDYEQHGDDCRAGAGEAHGGAKAEGRADCCTGIAAGRAGIANKPTYPGCSRSPPWMFVA